MKCDSFIKISLLIIVVLLALNLILPLLSNTIPSYASRSIQYKVIDCENYLRTETELEKFLNEYGKEGWELINFPRYTAIFKR